MKIVIDISKDRYDEIMSMDWKNCRRFFDEEIRAIHDGKALEQQPCTDAISRQAVLDALDKSKYSNEFCEEHHIDWSINLGMAHIVVNELKPISPQPKMGRWISYNWNDNGIARWGIKCDQCYKEYRYGGEMGGTYKYCPDCGAKMQEVEG